MEVISVILGILAGLLGFLPLLLSLRSVRTMDAQSSAAGYMTPVLLGLTGSILVLAVCTIICVVVARPVAVSFVLAEGATLIVAAIGFGIVRVVTK